MANIVKSKPENILEFCTKWFKYRKGDPTRNHNGEDDSDDDSGLFVTIPDEEFKIQRKEKLRKGRKKRFGMTSEVYGPYARRQSMKLANGFPKAEHTHMRLLFFCQNNFLFRNFSES